MATHVDDVFWGGTDIFEKKIVDTIRKTFKMSKENHSSFMYLGLFLEETPTGIILNQKDYVKELQKIEIQDERSKQTNDELNETEKHQLRSVIGQLNWLCTQTRPDISFGTCQASITYKDSTIKTIIAVNKTIRKLQNEEFDLKFVDLGDLRKCKFLVFSDASYRNLLDGGSQGGYIIFLANNDNKVIPIQWQSRRIRRIVRSTLAAECLSLLDAVEAAFLLKCLLNEMLKDHTTDVKIESFIDNKSLYDAINTTKCVEDKRLRIDIASLREKLENKEVSKVSWLDTRFQLADCLTKSGASSKGLLEVLKTNQL